MSADLMIYAVSPRATNIVHDALRTLTEGSIIGDSFDPEEVEHWAKNGVLAIEFDEWQKQWNIVYDSINNGTVSTQWIG